MTGADYLAYLERRAQETARALGRIGALAGYAIQDLEQRRPGRARLRLTTITQIVEEQKGGGPG
jgi:hypothetical protein